MRDFENAAQNRKLTILINVRSILCFILLLSTLLYSGRAVYSVICLSVFVGVTLHHRIGIKSITIACVIILQIILQLLKCIVKNEDINSIFNILMIYIPIFVMLPKGGLLSGFESYKNIICIVSVQLNFLLLYQYVLFGYSRGRVDFLGSSINYLASINCIFLVFYLYCLSVKNKRGLILYLALGCTLLTIALSLSRVCILFAVLSVFLYCTFNLYRHDNRHKVKTLLKYILLVNIIIIALYFLYVQMYNSSFSFKESMDSFEYYFERIKMLGIGESRLVLWKNALKAIKENILFGVGNPQILDFMNAKAPAHNFILEILLISGVIGLGIYVWVFYKEIKILYDRTTSAQRFFIVALCINYWGINFLQPFISTGYFFNTLFGLMLTAISFKKNEGIKHV